MGVFRSNDPTTWDDIDGIVVNESAPAPNVAGVAANVAILVGQTQRGPTDLTEVGSIGQLHEIYGKDMAFGVNKALKGKKFGRLRIIRVVDPAAVTASKIFIKDGSPDVEVIKFEAKQGSGVYGNNIQVKIEAGSSAGKKYTIKDTTPGSVMTQEIYDNVVITEVQSKATFAGSMLVVATVLATTAEADNIAFTALAGGTAGAVEDADYETAIAQAEVDGAGNILFLDAYNAARNGFLEAHAAETKDKMVIVCGAETDTVAQAITDVANYRDTEGRIIYAYPYVGTMIDGVEVFQAPASFYASVISQTAPNVDPAYVKNAGFLTGITRLKRSLTRSDYVNLNAAGISAFEYVDSVGFKIKNGVTTQIADSSLVMVLRRRMADFLTNSAARFLVNFQNAVNSKANRTLVKGSLEAFVKRLEDEGILPKDSEVTSGKAKIIDTESLNTDNTIAQGMFKILWRQRIFSSMRFIVLQAEIGESVVVTEGAA